MLGGTGDGSTPDHGFSGGSRLVLPVFRNRDVYFVIDDDYWMYFLYNGETFTLPQNWFFKSISILIVTGIVVYQIATSIESAFFWTVSMFDGVFKRVYDACETIKSSVSSKQTERLLNNIYKILGILLLLLAVLNRLEVIDVTAIPKWLVPI